MSPSTATRPITLNGLQSFYVPGGNADLIRFYGRDSDAIVLSGPAGPSTIRRLKKQGWSGVFLFDGAAYLHPEHSVDRNRWADDQLRAGAERVLSPGRFVDGRKGSAPFEEQVCEELAWSIETGATCVLALHYRYLTDSQLHNDMLGVLRGLDVPVALVLAHPADPLGHNGAVGGFVNAIRRINDVSVLRIDHGGLGALVFNAAHASIGHSSGLRHLVPPTSSGGGIPNDTSFRVFVADLLDYHTASTISGWSAAHISLACNFPCCRGQHLARFLDPRRSDEALNHNKTVLTALSERIITIPEAGMRVQEFASLCRDAVDRYGVLGGGLHRLEPSWQLQQWAMYAG